MFLNISSNLTIRRQRMNKFTPKLQIYYGQGRLGRFQKFFWIDGKEQYPNSPAGARILAIHFRTNYLNP
jgi:hypothetical protein